MNIHHKVADRYSLIDTPQRFFLIASAYIVRKETMELFRTVQLREESPPYELPLTNFSCKMKERPYQQIRAFQTYIPFTGK